MLLDYLEPFRMMGHDLTIDAPIPVPLVIAIRLRHADAFADKVALAGDPLLGRTDRGRAAGLLPSRQRHLRQAAFT